jgi:hypothetical protein
LAEKEGQSRNIICFVPFNAWMTGSYSANMCLSAALSTKFPENSSKKNFRSQITTLKFVVK